MTGLNGGENVSVIVAQTEWYDTPVCFVGGYGNSVAAIDFDDVAKKLPGVLDDYFDKDTVFTVKEISVDLTALTSEDESRIEVCECCGGRNISPEPYDDGWCTRTWCPDCEEEHYGTNLKEYKEKRSTHGGIRSTTIQRGSCPGELRTAKRGGARLRSMSSGSCTRRFSGTKT